MYKYSVSSNSMVLQYSSTSNNMGLCLILWTKPKSRNTTVCFNNVKRQHKCGPAIISILLHMLVLLSLVYPINSLEISNHQLINQTFRSDEEFRKLKKMIATDLQRINKPAVKTIHSPDGDIIDCVLTHKQPAFDHPLLKGQKPLDPPKRPRWHNQIGNSSEIFQLWSLSDESCPEGTIPIRRTTEQDILRVSSLNRFGRKLIDASNVHEHSVGYLNGGFYKGAKATLSVWAPHVESQEFSLAQIWVMSGTFGKDLNSIEAGWQVSPQLYGDNRPRIFIYWTADAYKHGCYNLKCPGFVQISKKFALGAGISPVSKYNGPQFTITLSIWKNPKDGNWWLNYGPGNGIALGYWPSSLFTHLKGNADTIEFGGEITNTKSSGSHTSTQMGSGHYAEEGYGKAAYINDIQVLDSNSKAMVSPDLKYIVESPNCYTIHEENDKDGKYLYYGGPGRNEKCS